MPKVTFLPMNTVCDAQEGDSILDVAIENKVPLKHSCGGQCNCATCHVHVKESPQSLSTMEELEEHRLCETALDLRPESRLGCQAKVCGDVVVYVVNQER